MYYSQIKKVKILLYKRNKNKTKSIFYISEINIIY